MSVERPELLFVDDEQRILDGLRRQLRTHREHWEMRFALCGESALAMLAENPADILVSDMRMPGLSGGQLLQKVRELYPQTTRIILSGQTDQADLLRELGCIHQYLQKPCDPGTLCAAIERTAAISSQLCAPTLRRAVSRVTSLPPRSASYDALIAELNNPDADIGRVGQIVAADPAFTAKLLQLVNSAFFGMPRKMTKPQDAVVMLGLKTLQSIVLAGRLFDHVSAGSAVDGAIGLIWDQSLEISGIAADLARAADASSAVQQSARLAGMLCLIGRAVLMGSNPPDYQKAVKAARAEKQSLAAAERAFYGASQDEVSAYALGLWAFPDELVEAVAYQSRPKAVPGGKASQVTRFLNLARAIDDQSRQSADVIELDNDAVASRELQLYVEKKIKGAA